jgi:hypothetical protein
MRMEQGAPPVTKTPTISDEDMAKRIKAALANWTAQLH